MPFGNICWKGNPVADIRFTALDSRSENLCSFAGAVRRRFLDFEFVIFDLFGIWDLGFRVSASVPHFPHSKQRPDHFGNWASQLEQI
jgi:hypothetical protein